MLMPLADTPRDLPPSSPPQQQAAVHGSAWTNPLFMTFTAVADVLDTVEDKGEAVVRLPLPYGRSAWIIRDQERWAQLAAHSRLDRDHAHGFSRECFGNPIFTAAYGPSEDPADQELHQTRKADLKDKVSPAKVLALAPRIGAAADQAVGAMLASAGKPLDLDRQLLAYLFAMGGEALAGRPVDLSAHAGVFQSSIDVMAKRVGSPVRSALALASQRLAGLLARDAKEARHALHDLARALVEAAASGPVGNHIAVILARHNIDIRSPWQRSRNCPEVTAALDEVAMEFAASVFTTASMMTLVVNHFIHKPAELDALRELMDAEAPAGPCAPQALFNTPAVRSLFLTLLDNLPVNVGARGAVDAFDFTDSQGHTHAIGKNDVVLFDLRALQKRCTPALRRLMENAPADRPVFDFLDARGNRGMLPMFFAGPTLCPGRYLAIQEALVFMLKFFAQCEPRWLHDGTPAVKLGVVNGVEGRPPMVVQRLWHDASAVMPHELPDVQATLQAALQAPGPVTVHGPDTTAAIPAPPTPSYGCPLHARGAHPLARP